MLSKQLQTLLKKALLYGRAADNDFIIDYKKGEIFVFDTKDCSLIAAYNCTSKKLELFNIYLYNDIQINLHQALNSLKKEVNDIQYNKTV